MPPFGKVIKGKEAWNVWDGEGYIPYGSEEDARSAASQLLSQRRTVPASDATGLPEAPPGFFGTLVGEAERGLGEVVKGGREFVGLGERPSLGGLVGPGSPHALGRMALGGLAIFPGAPIEALAEFGGEKVHEATKGLPILGDPIAGVAPADVLAGVTKGALQYASPAGIARGVLRAGAKARSLLPSGFLESQTEVEKLAKGIRSTPVSLEEAGQTILGRLPELPTQVSPQAFENLARAPSASISPSRLGKLRTGRELSEEVLPQAAQKARARVNSLYERAKKAGGDELFSQPNTEAALKSIAEESERVQGVLPTSAEKLARRLGEPPRFETPEFTKAQEQLTQLQQQGVKGLPQDLLEEFGLTEGRQRTVRGMIELRQRIRERGRAAQFAKNDNLTRQLKEIEAGITQDLASGEVAARAPQAARFTNEADQAYRTQVAPFFTKRAFARKLSDQDAEDVVDTVFKKNNVTEIRNVKGAINQLPIAPTEKVGQFRRLSRAWYDDLIERSRDQTTGEFNKNGFIKTWENYAPEVKKEILGLKLHDEVQQSVNLMKKAEANVPPPTLVELLSDKLRKKEVNSILTTAIEGNRLDELRVLKTRFRDPAEWGKLTRAWMDDLVQRSIDPATQQFSNRSFLRHLNGVDEPVRRTLLGSAHSANLDLLGAEMARTSRSIVSEVGQPSPFLGRIGIVGLASNLMQGRPLQALRSGFVFMTPGILARMLENPHGVILLKEAAKVQPNTERATVLGSRISVMVNALASENQQEQRKPISLPVLPEELSQ